MLEEPRTDGDYGIGTEQMVNNHYRWEEPNAEARKHVYECKHLWRKSKKPKYINLTVWRELKEHWTKQETEDLSAKNSENR